ncbi:MAG: GTP-binding protein, partial [Trichococcus flocculiformis]
PLTYWLATLPKAERMQVLSEDPEIKERWHPLYGDRLTEIVFIGIDMHQSGIEAALDLCLVDEAALQSGLYSKTSPYPWEVSIL